MRRSFQLTVDTSATASPPPSGPSVVGRQCVAACLPECASACVAVHPSPLPPSPSIPPPNKTVVDLGASLAQLCVAVPNCSPSCTPSCLEKTAISCAPDCVSACRTQCSAQQQPAASCAPACNAVCAATCWINLTFSCILVVRNFASILKFKLDV